MSVIFRRVKVFGLEKPSIRESGICALAVDALWIDVDDERIDVNVVFNVVDAVCIGR